jgi:hypothetical protein
MFPFTKVETSEKKVVELSPPRSDSMDRSEHPHINAIEVKMEINPIDYDSEDEVDDEVDDEVSEINGLFETKPSVVETVSSLKIEKESKETSEVKVEIAVDNKVEESFRSVLCNLLSKCFKKSVCLFLLY